MQKKGGKNFSFHMSCANFTFTLHSCLFNGLNFEPVKTVLKSYFVFRHKEEGTPV